MAQPQGGLVSVGLSRADFKSTEAQLRQVMANFKDREVRVKRAIVTAVNKVGKRVESGIAKDISSKIAIKQKDVRQFIKLAKASAANPVAFVRLSKSRRIPLKSFGARQVAKGVSYRIERSGPRKFIPGAFGPEIDRLGRHVFKRVGATRLPIVKLHGPSPWGVFVKSGMREKTKVDATAWLHRELKEQIRVAALRARGTIRS